VNAVALAWVLICVAGTLLSLKSVWTIRMCSPWTAAGWCLTALYFVLAGAKVAAAWPPPFHAEYVCLVLLTVAFVGAGLRDERQAEPWWWPERAGLRGRERRNLPKA
jgi:hypothetical protein